MSNYVITVTADTTPDTFLQDAATGTVRFHRERGNGTFRRIHFLAPETKERETAEYIVAMRDNGETMKAIARSLVMSVAAVRRMINDLIMTEELEAMDAEELADLLIGAEEATDAPADTAVEGEGQKATEVTATETN